MTHAASSQCMHDMGKLMVFIVRIVAHFVVANAVEPHAGWLRAIGLIVGQGRSGAGGIPLARHRAGVAADANI